MAKKDQREPFEALYARLEERVAKLEEGGLSLEEAIAVYEEGMALARECQQRLDDADLKITRLKEAFAATPGRARAGYDADDGSDDDPDPDGSFD
jgi:exodeoxyribonuclease VII small subunit